MEKNAVSVAKDILRLAKERGEVMSQMKLIKLTYIAYGFYLAIYDKNLFKDKIEAWQYGPVIPDLYYDYTRQYGSDSVPVPKGGLNHPDIEKFLNKLLDVYLKYTALQLSNLTHRIGTPWKQIYKGGKSLIPDDIISAYYKKLSVDRESVNT